jgi:hypothetical protein
MQKDRYQQSSERRVKIKVGAMGVRLIGDTVVTVPSSQEGGTGHGRKESTLLP